MSTGVLAAESASGAAAVAAAAPASVIFDDRHVVFADAMRGPRRAVNLAPGLPSSLRAAPRSPGPLTEAERSFVRWLFRRAGLDARDYRDESLARRIPACLRILRADNLAAARALIEQDPRRLQTAIDAMIIGVTSFFRDRAMFDAIQNHVVPLVTRGRLNLRAWCAGCSSGAEVYSLAIVLARCGWLHRTHLLGTDCRPGAIHDSAGGVYDFDSVRALGREALEQFFVPTDAGRAWRVRASLQTMITWRAGDVLHDQPPGPWDLILCRNLAMYLRPEATARLWDRLYRALRPGGVLVLGKAERPIGIPMKCLHSCIFQRDPQVS